MTFKVRLFLSSIAGLCFGLPVGWGVGWVVLGWVWGIDSGAVVGSTLVLVAYRLMEPLMQPEPPYAMRDVD